MGKVVPEDLWELAKQVEAQVVPPLDKADAALYRGREITAGMFTSTTMTLASTYAVAVEFMAQELTTKHADIDAFAKLLRDTAQNWADTEHSNTMRPGG